MSSKSITFKQFEAGLNRLPDAVRIDLLPKARQAITKKSMPLLHLSRVYAYLNTGNAVDKTGYIHTMKLYDTIQLFINDKNKNKAYVVIGEQVSKARLDDSLAYYARFVRTGHATGRNKKNLTDAPSALNKREANKFLRLQAGHYLPPKNYFAKAWDHAGNQIDEAIANELDDLLMNVIDNNI